MMLPMARYLTFVDDSGTKEYGASPSDYDPRGNSRYFVFGAVVAQEDVAATLSGKIAELKRATFGRADVELKSNWLRIPKERERRYRRPFSVTDDDLTALVEGVYAAVGGADIKLIAAVVDKVHMQADYGVRAWYPPTIAYEFLMQRVVQEVPLPDMVAVTMDDMSGATPKGNQFKRNLRAHHGQLCVGGSRLLRSVSFASLEHGLRFVNSAQSNMIQAADIVAYNVYRQFADHGERWEDGIVRPLPTYHWFERLGPKFRAGPGGRIQGYGVVKAPLRNRIRWAYVP